MESIYNPTIFQRIVDHFGIGRLLKITRLDNVSTNIWRHQVETRHGVFEIFSSPSIESNLVVEKLGPFISTQLGIEVKANKLPLCHSFDRHHRLLVIQIRHQISPHQLESDLKRLKNQEVIEAFRGFHNLIILKFKNGTTLNGGWNWSLQKDYQTNHNQLVVDSMASTFLKIDKSLNEFIKTKPKFLSAQLVGRWTELFFENDYSFHFYEWQDNATLSISWPNKKHLDIYNQQKIYHGKFVVNEADYPYQLARHLPGKPKSSVGPARYQDKHSYQLTNI